MLYRNKFLNNNGSIIIIGLLTLTLLSLLGLASTNKSQTDISIAGNSKDIEMSLYASEVALVFAETSVNRLDQFDKLNEEEIAGHYGVGDKHINEFEAPENSEIGWTSSDSLKIANSQIPQEWRDNMSSNPRYIIVDEKMVSDCDTLSNDCVNTGINIYRIVAIGKGSSNKTTTMLESTYHWRHR